MFCGDNYQWAWRANFVIWDPGQISTKQNLLAKDEKFGFHASFYILFQSTFLLFDSDQSLSVTFSLESIHTVSENEFSVSPRPKIAQAQARDAIYEVSMIAAITL